MLDLKVASLLWEGWAAPNDCPSLGLHLTKPQDPPLHQQLERVCNLSLTNKQKHVKSKAFQRMLSVISLAYPAPTNHWCIHLSVKLAQNSRAPTIWTCNSGRAIPQKQLQLSDPKRSSFWQACGFISPFHSWMTQLCQDSQESVQVQDGCQGVLQEVPPSEEGHVATWVHRWGSQGHCLHNGSWSCA